jgi:flagellar M-ring protein FliF
MQNTLNSMKVGWRKVPQIAKMFLYAIIVAAIIFLLVSMFAPEKYKLLYTGLEPEDSLEIQQYLSTKGVDYKLNEDGSSIMADGDIILLKRDLALQNLPQGDSAGGLASFDNLTIGSTKYDKEIQYQNHLQQELETSIVETFEGIVEANVKLPKIEEKSIFKDDEQNLDISVGIKTKNGYEMTSDNVRAIQIFVAGSIQEVKADDVEVVDSKMNVLSKSEDGTSTSSSSGKQTEIVKEAKVQIEKELMQTLTEIYGKVRVIANVDINFDEIVQNIEKYDPEGTIISKEEAKEATREGKKPDGGLVGTDQNGEVPRYEIEDLKPEDTLYLQDKNNLIENFVVGKTVDKIIKYPELRNINVAVWVDQDLSQMEIEELEEMISISSGLTGQAARDMNNKAVYDNGSVKVSQRQFALVDAAEDQTPVETGFEMKWWYWAIAGLVLLMLIGIIIALLASRNKRKKAFLVDSALAEEQEKERNNGTVDLEIGEEYPTDAAIKEKFKFEWTNKQANLRESTNEVSKKFPKETADVIKKLLKNSND